MAATEASVWDSTVAHLAIDHEVHVLRAVEQLRPKSLRHAARHAEHGVPLHAALHLAQPPHHPLLSVLANRARVDEDDVCAVRLRDRLVA